MRTPIFASIERLVGSRFLKSQFARHQTLFNIYLSEALKMFGVSMISVFETIYLYLFFVRTGTTHSATAVFLFFSLFFAFFALLSPLGAYLASRFGFQRVALISTPFLFLYHLFLFLLPRYHWLLFFALAAIVIRASIFWPGFHLLFANSSSKERRGTAFSGLALSGAFASVLGPVAGGYIISRFGYPTLFLLVLPLTLSSALPLFFIKNIPPMASENLRKTLKRFTNPAELKAGVAFLASGAEDESNGRLWPLFLFILNISYTSLGIIVSLATMLSIIATWYLGQLTDKKDRLRLLRLGSATTSGAWLIRAGTTTPLFAGLANMFYGIARAGYMVPLMTTFYDRSVAATNPFGAIVFREVMINAGRAFYLAFLAFVALWTTDFRILIILTALLPIFFNLVRHWKP